MAVLCFDADQTETFATALTSLLPGCDHITNTTNCKQLRQQAGFLEWLHASQHPVALTTETVMTPIAQYVSCLETPSVSTPMHTNIAAATLLELYRVSRKYSVQNEFSGLKTGIFPVDCVVYLDDKIAAFIEIDGRYHYTADGGQLRRQNLLKEYLYAQNYPGVPMFRVKNAEAMQMSVQMAAKSLAELVVYANKD